MGTEVEQRSEKQYQCWQVALYGIQSHIQLFWIAKLRLQQILRWSVSKGTSYSAQTGSWTQLRPFMVHPPFQLDASPQRYLPMTGISLSYPSWTGREGSNDKSVPVPEAKEPIYVAHTYCFFCACEARSLAFSLAASAVSLARSVAVSAKVLDGISPKKKEKKVNILDIIIGLNICIFM